MSEYANLLRSPLWQKKRLEILGARGFKCEECGSTDQELHVHHRHYEKGRKPWEYGSESYAVYCSKCHKDRHAVEQALRVDLGRLESRSLQTLGLLLRLLGDQATVRCTLSAIVVREAADREEQGTLTAAQRAILGTEWMDAVIEHIEARKDTEATSR